MLRWLFGGGGKPPSTDNTFSFEKKLKTSKFMGTNNTCYYFKDGNIVRKWNQRMGLEITKNVPVDFADKPPAYIQHSLVFRDEMRKLGLTHQIPIIDYGRFDVFEIYKNGKWVYIATDGCVCYKIECNKKTNVAAIWSNDGQSF